MMPSGYEAALLGTLMSKQLSLFACDEYTVFSDGNIGISAGPPDWLTTEDVGTVKSTYGGPFNLALNSDVFVNVWKKVFSTRKFDLCDWTVKVDPDAVFFPDRLRSQVQDSRPDDHIYLNNCDQGLHGPIEVISHGGMDVFQSGVDDCVSTLKHEWDQSGEDVFLRHCLGKLDISRVDNFQLLSEDRCLWENPVKNGCNSGKVSFHPFKNEKAWMTCWEEAKKAPIGNTPSARVLKSAEKCSGRGQECSTSKCCSDKGFSCQQKNKWWAGCLRDTTIHFK